MPPLRTPTVITVIAALSGCAPAPPEAPVRPAPGPVAEALVGGVVPVTTGVVIRGLSMPGIPAPGQKTGRTCDFSREDVDQNGRMTDASVQCQPGGTYASTIGGLAPPFTAYCMIDAKRLPGGARLIPAPVSGNANHCSLSAVKPKDATGFFGGATWR
ncbi:hypothetical protein [Phenylobacterium sp.]|uniref:hypothetical protein n=1 Tax=Phenylobacterium sp. TaxID=1871053 RepID=UPI00286B034D|nr:hypothetical protein [Phenylobacterium sp.]